MNESKLDLIAKLLAKAESTTPAEAEALTEHAERLMVKYGIEQARIDERRARAGQSTEEIIQERVAFTGSYARDLRELGIRVANGLGSVRPLLSERYDGAAVLHLVGYASDVQQARLLTASLQVQAMVAMRAWWAAKRDVYWWGTESDKRRARSGFVRGFGAGAGERIASNRARLIEDAGTGTDLVLASRRDRVDAAAAAMTVGKARRRKGTDARAYGAGRASGHDASTGERAVTDRRRRPA